MYVFWSYLAVAFGMEGLESETFLNFSSDFLFKSSLIRNKTPNTEFSPPLASFIADENDNQAMKGDILNLFLGQW